ncbi:SIR2 family protein [Nocardia goodfellowii]|uniref:SIR2-like domain-containing protein n=1 Tax=Nocardia goodfellowii TaxID=882446 RepID=A0ABS4QBF2_9NOCA|nr:SIR2 family protein [Nocardia goodfellowii]MBP2189022.1 hypothetical protein [Nocardia goodfellowii]
MTDEEIKSTNNLISFTRQPELKRLVEKLQDPSCRVTIFCGAGLTTDAGLPTWHGLIRRLAELIQIKESEGIRAAILADEASLTRKADLILALLPDYKQNSDAIADALYSVREENGDFGGQLAMAVAKLSALLGERCRIITTNYDDQIEESLRLVGEKRAVAAMGLPTQITGIDAYGNRTADRRGVQRSAAEWLDQKCSDWLDQLFSDSKNTVLHLHGYISSRPDKNLGDRSRIEPIMLRESDYLAYGPQVQVLIEQAIGTKNSITLFVGTGMTDPSVVGPLASLADTAGSNDIFCLLSSDGVVSPEHDMGIPGQTAFSYRLSQKTYLAERLGVSAILLKSYSQVAQVVMELCAAIEDPQAYLESDADKSIRYGFRFRRVLAAVHDIVGTKNGCVAPSDDFSRDLSEALDGVICATDGPLDFAQRIVRGCTAAELGGYKLEQDQLKHERFGLFLWLRQFAPDAASTAEFKVFMAGSSAYAHRDGANLGGRLGWVLPNSEFSAAKSVFRGQTVIDYLDFDRYDDAKRPWRTFIAVPLGCSESDLGIGAQSEHSVLIGSVVLHSTMRIREKGDPENPRDTSQLSLLSHNQRLKLAQLIAEAGVKAIQVLQRPTSN